MKSLYNILRRVPLRAAEVVSATALGLVLAAATPAYADDVRDAGSHADVPADVVDETLDATVDLPLEVPLEEPEQVEAVKSAPTRPATAVPDPCDARCKAIYRTLELADIPWEVGDAVPIEGHPGVYGLIMPNDKCPDSMVGTRWLDVGVSIRSEDGTEYIPLTPRECKPRPKPSQFPGWRPVHALDFEKYLKINKMSMDDVDKRDYHRQRGDILLLSPELAEKYRNDSGIEGLFTSLQGLMGRVGALEGQYVVIGGLVTRVTALEASDKRQDARLEDLTTRTDEVARQAGKLLGGRIRVYGEVRAGATGDRDLLLSGSVTGEARFLDDHVRAGADVSAGALDVRTSEDSYTRTTHEGDAVVVDDYKKETLLFRAEAWLKGCYAGVCAKVGGGYGTVHTKQARTDTVPGVPPKKHWTGGIEHEGFGRAEVSFEGKEYDVPVEVSVGAEHSDVLGTSGVVSGAVKVSDRLTITTEHKIGNGTYTGTVGVRF